MSKTSKAKEALKALEEYRKPITAGAAAAGATAAMSPEEAEATPTKWYNRTIKFLEELPTNAAPPQSWAQMLKSGAQKGRIPTEDADAILDKLLALEEARIPKTSVLDIAKMQDPELGEIRLGDRVLGPGDFSLETDYDGDSLNTLVDRDGYAETIFTSPKSVYMSPNHFQNAPGDRAKSVGHVRTSRVQDPETGEWVRLVEEIQSDRHQRGRKYGYTDQQAVLEINPKSTAPAPDGPFKDTSEHSLLGLRRALWEAAESGEDYVAIAPSDEQIRRYGTDPDRDEGFRYTYDKLYPSLLKKEARRLGLPESNVTRLKLGKDFAGQPKVLDEVFILRDNFELSGKDSETLTTLFGLSGEQLTPGFIGDLINPSEVLQAIKKPGFERLAARAGIPVQAVDNVRYALDRYSNDEQYKSDAAEKVSALVTLIQEGYGKHAADRSQFAIRLTPEVRERILKEGLPHKAEGGLVSKDPDMELLRRYLDGEIVQPEEDLSDLRSRIAKPNIRDNLQSLTDALNTLPTGEELIFKHGADIASMLDPDLDLRNTLGDQFGPMGRGAGIFLDATVGPAFALEKAAGAPIAKAAAKALEELKQYKTATAGAAGLGVAGTPDEAEAGPTKWYNRTLRFLESIPTKAAPPQSWAQMIKSGAQKGQLPTEDADQLLDLLLNIEQGRRISKEEVVDAAGMFDPALRERRLGEGEVGAIDYRVDPIRPEEERIKYDLPEVYSVSAFERPADWEKPYPEEMRLLKMFPVEKLAAREGAAGKELYQSLDGNGTRFPGDSLEDALKGQGIGYPEASNRRKSKYSSFVTPGPVDDYKETAINSDMARDYPDGHYSDQPGGSQNILHVRTSQRPLPDGSKVRLIEEIQSDRHQLAREDGYRTLEQTQELKKLDRRIREVKEKREAALRRSNYLLSPDTPFDDAAVRENTETIQQLNSELDELYDAHAEKNMASGKVPDAPFKELQEYGTLGIRRALWEAAENGEDYVAITPASEQVRRYPGDKKREEGFQYTYDKIYPSLMKKEARRLGLPESAVVRVPMPQHASQPKALMPQLVDAYVSNGVSSEATHTLDQLLRLDPGDEDSVNRLADIDFARLSRVSNDPGFARMAQASGVEPRRLRELQQTATELTELQRQLNAVQRGGNSASNELSEGDLEDAIMELDMDFHYTLHSVLENIHGKFVKEKPEAPQMFAIRLTPEVREKILKEGLPHKARGGLIERN